MAFEKTHSIFVFGKALIISGDSYQEEQRVDVLKAMYPFLSLRSLSTNIEHAVLQGAEIKVRLGNTGGTEACAQHILVSRNEFLVKETIEVNEETVARLVCGARDQRSADILAQIIMKSEFISLFHHLLESSIFP